MSEEKLNFKRNAQTEFSEMEEHITKLQGLIEENREKSIN